MNMVPSFTNLRAHLSHQFFKLRARARWDSVLAKLTGRELKLALFPDETPEKSPNRRFMGTQDIRLEQITGTLNRQSDFDNRFRPLNRHLRDRWVNIHLMLQREGWSPILVHRVDDRYYVEDGHHRVSVAKALGFSSIAAKVWHYPCEVKETHNCRPAPCPEQRQAPAYTPVTE